MDGDLAQCHYCSPPSLYYCDYKCPIALKAQDEAEEEGEEEGDDS